MLGSVPADLGSPAFTQECLTPEYEDSDDEAGPPEAFVDPDYDYHTGEEDDMAGQYQYDDDWPEQGSDSDMEINWSTGMGKFNIVKG